MRYTEARAERSRVGSYIIGQHREDEDAEDMGGETLGMQHLDLIRDTLKLHCNGVSEYSFANLYLFREKHDYEIIFDDYIAIYGKSYDNYRYVMPLFDISTVDKKYLFYLMQSCHFLFPIHESNLNGFLKNDFTASYNRDDSDYIFSSGKFISYRGNRLRGKRNLLNRFLKTYAPTARPLNDSNKNDAVLVLNRWQEQAVLPHEGTDYAACLEALALREVLELFGFIYYVDNKPCGFIIAEELTPEMCAMHFYKGEREFKGIYEYMFSHFATHYADRYKFFNFEQDLGHKGLRTAKSQYHPDYVNRKFRMRVCV